MQMVNINLFTVLSISIMKDLSLPPPPPPPLGFTWGMSPQGLLETRNRSHNTED